MGGGYREVTLGEMDTPHPTERQKAKLPSTECCRAWDLPLKPQNNNEC